MVFPHVFLSLFVLQTSCVHLIGVDMDEFCTSTTMVAFMLWLLSILLNTNDTEQMPLIEECNNDGHEALPSIVDSGQCPVTNTVALMMNTLHNFRLCTAFIFLDDDLAFSVKPCSTTWFSHFLLEQYDSHHWVSMFRMAKPSVLPLPRS